MAAHLSHTGHDPIPSGQPVKKKLPASPQALGEILDADGDRLFTIAFSTHRDLITEIGYTVSESCPATLQACVACICELAKEQAIMAAELLGPGEILEKLFGDGTPDDQTIYHALQATLGLKNALASYAGYKKADLQAWKAQGSPKI